MFRVDYISAFFNYVTNFMQLISMLYIEHTNQVSKQRKTLRFPLF